MQFLVKTAEEQTAVEDYSPELRIFLSVFQKEISLTQEQDFDNLHTQKKEGG